MKQTTITRHTAAAATTRRRGEKREISRKQRDREMNGYGNQSIGW